MELFYYVYLFIFWTLFWSFSSVIISRIKNHKSWIIAWRSECPKCKHKLWILDLFPIFSYLSTLGKCRYCHKKISILYPILEFSLWIIFVLTSYFLIDFNQIIIWNKFEIFKLIFFLIFWFLSFVYIVYDILYLEIPDIILAILILITTIAITLQSYIPWFEIFRTLPLYDSWFWIFNLNLILWWLITSIWILYIIMLKWFSEIIDVILIFLIIWIICFLKFYIWIDIEKTAIWSALISCISIFIFFFLQIIISWWSWMWGWDLRIAILMWLISWITFWFEAVMISYFAWSIIWIIFIIYAKIKSHNEARKKFSNKIRRILWLEQKVNQINTQIPFWPFLWIWIYWVILFTPLINEFIKNYL